MPKINKRNIMFTALAVLMAGLAGWIGVSGNNQQNPVVIAMSLPFFFGAFMLIRKVLEDRPSGVEVGDAIRRKKDGEPDITTPNSLNLYPLAIKFEYDAAPMGLRKKCLNDGKLYHVHKYDIDGHKSEFVLPDDDEGQRHYDPREFANVVTMSSNKKYFAWSGSIVQKVSMAIMGIIIGGEIIGLIAIGG